MLKPGLPFATTTYTTPEASATWLGKMFPTLCFYIKYAWFIISHGCRATAGKYTGTDWAYGSLQIVRALEESGVTLHMEGLENITRHEGPCVFIANHMSTLETMVLPGAIQPLKDVTFVAKKELVEMPFFGAILRSRNPVTVGRKNPREDLAAMLEGGTQRLAAGCSIIVFPQSTRSHTFDPAKFNSIGIKLARKAGVPVVPVALLTNAWGVGSLSKDFGPIHPQRPVRIAFGTPLHIAAQGKEEHAAVCDFIQWHLEKWEQEKQDSLL